MTTIFQALHGVFPVRHILNWERTSFAQSTAKAMELLPDLNEHGAKRGPNGKPAAARPMSP